MNNINKPLVSILLPVHNCDKFLTDCLKSLVAQSYSQIEIIAIDDFSTDDSLKILKCTARKYKVELLGSLTSQKKISLFINLLFTEYPCNLKQF